MQTTGRSLIPGAAVLVLLLIVLTPSALLAQEAPSESVADAAAPRPDADGFDRAAELDRQVPFVRNGGVLNQGEVAFVASFDAALLPPPLMISIQYGLLYWLTLGVEVGANVGVVQALFHVRSELYRHVRSERFFWGNAMRTGFKSHQIDINDELAFDDVSWILTYENSFAVRLGRDRRHALYLSTILYIDFDITNRDRQVDWYLIPASLGYEAVLGRQGNFFIEVGMAYSINGTETPHGLLYEGDWFPMGSLGVAYRSEGPRTALDRW